MSLEDVTALASVVIGALLAILARRDEFNTTAELAHWVDGPRLAYIERVATVLYVVESVAASPSPISLARP